MPDIPLELLLVLPLGMAAGIDLYLTLLAIAVAPRTPWWNEPLPGALGDLDAPVVPFVLAALFLTELWAERHEGTGLAWHACHTLIRPISGALLGALLLHGQPAPMLLGGALATGAVAWLAHAIRSGRMMLDRWAPTQRVRPALASLLEDVIVLGLALAALDRPRTALTGAVLVCLAGIPRGRSHVRAFVFVVRLAAARALQVLRQRAWVEAGDLPDWVLDGLRAHAHPSGGTVRGSPAGALGVPGLPLFATGWVAQQGRHLFFVHRRRWRPRCVALGTLEAREVVEHGFFRGLDLTAAAGDAARLYFLVTGPTAESLSAAFSASDREVHRSRTVQI